MIVDRRIAKLSGLGFVDLFHCDACGRISQREAKRDPAQEH